MTTSVAEAAATDINALEAFCDRWQRAWNEHDGDAAAALCAEDLVYDDPALMNEPFSFDEGGQPNPWTYEQVELGYNYRMNELEAALGCSQLRKLHRFVGRRAELATLYTEQLQARIPGVEPTLPPAGEASGWHLFSVRINFAKHGLSRAEVMKRLAGRGVGTQVHYIPLHFQPALKKRLRYGPLRGAEAYYERTLSLPLFPSMDDEDVERVVAALEAVLSGR